MGGLERARYHALRIAVALSRAGVLHRVIDDLSAIAAKHSPSSAFTRGMAAAQARGLQHSALAVAKLARWLAVVRRDHGDAEFSKLISEIRSLAQASAGLGNMQDTQHGVSSIQHMQVSGVAGIVPGIYRFGRYDWLGEVWVDKISRALKKLYGLELPGYMQQLALEVFHSLYLLNTELEEVRIRHSPFLKAIAEMTEPIRSSEKLRSLTVGGEMESIEAACTILKPLIERIESSQELKAAIERASLEGAGIERDHVDEFRGICKRAIEDAESRELDSSRRAADAVRALSASKHRHQLSFEDKVDLYRLLKEKKVFAGKLLEAVRSIEDSPGRAGGSIDFAGYGRISSLRELPWVRAVEHAYPEHVFLKRLAAMDLDVRKFREGHSGRRRRFIVLIDKSGSMGGEKIEWAKAVAVSLLMDSRTDRVKVLFFDSQPHEPIDLSRDFAKALRSILSVEAGGGTSIDAALKKADETAPGYTSILITDGEDRVSYRPRNDLVASMIKGDNEDLREISRKYIRVEELSGRIARRIAE